MATTATRPMRSLSPIAGGLDSADGGGHRRPTSESSRSAESPVKARSSSSQGSSKWQNSDSSLGAEESLAQDRPRSRQGLNSSWSKTNTSMSNRRRVAQAAAEHLGGIEDNSISNEGIMGLNDSTSSLKSDASLEGRVRSGRRSSSRGALNRERRRRQTSDGDRKEGDGKEEIPSSSRSLRPSRDSRRNGSRRESSRSRSKSRRRSKSTKSVRSRRPPGKSSSGDTFEGGRSRRGRTRTSGSFEEELVDLNDLNKSSTFIPPISPVRNKDTSPIPPIRNSHADGLSPPNSARSETSKLSIGDKDLMAFLEEMEPKSTNSQRLARSVPAFVLDESTRANRGTASLSQRRERSSGTGVRSSSSYKRPPRTNRGVNRARSDNLDVMMVSPGKYSSSRNQASPRTPTPSNSADAPSRSPPRRTRSASDEKNDLGEFFAKNSQVSRRKKPSGSKSVSSMPMRPRRSYARKQSDNDEKPPSSRSTVTSSDSHFPDDDEDETIAESIDDGFDEKNGGIPSNRSFGSDLGDSFRDLNVEAALQMHMSRTENLLYDVFPKHIAEALRSGRKVEPENHECVTIFFSDIVGFTQISSELDPMKISDLLDRLYNSFDALSHYHDVFKVETIGDAYMAVTNLIKEQPDHCKRIAEFAIDAIRVANQTLIDKDDPKRGFVNIRVGFHSGPVVSNVVGSRNPRFCLFGDTVNTASRMESNSAVNRIHCSISSADLLRDQHPALRLNPRGTIEVKGKGEMQTFWVNEDAAVKSQRDGSSRSIFKILKKTKRPKS